MKCPYTIRTTCDDEDDEEKSIFSLPSDILTPTRIELVEKYDLLILEGPVNEDMAELVRKGKMILMAKGSPQVTVKITSPGGDAVIGFEIHDQLASYNGGSVGLAYGMVASAASQMILQGCSYRVMMPHGRMICHFVHNISVNTLHTLESRGWRNRIIRDLKNGEEQMIEILMKRTGKDERTIRKLLVKELELTAKEALEFGLIDEIFSLDYPTFDKKKRVHRKTR